MKPVKQLFLHRPEQGIYGDCERAAWATILDLDILDVPHFFEGGCSANEAVKRQRAFEATLGLYHITLPFCVDAGVEGVLAAMGYNNPNAEYLLVGQSRNGTNHTVVCRGDKIVHDPALDNSGIVGPCDDGWFWITIFLKASKEP